MFSLSLYFTLSLFNEVMGLKTTFRTLPCKVNLLLATVLSHRKWLHTPIPTHKPVMWQAAKPSYWNSLLLKQDEHTMKEMILLTTTGSPKYWPQTVNSCRELLPCNMFSCQASAKQLICKIHITNHWKNNVLQSQKVQLPSRSGKGDEVGWCRVWA